MDSVVLTWLLNDDNELLLNELGPEALNQF